jgi:tetratricopeptide (TPR) repeat protein
LSESTWQSCTAEGVELYQQAKYREAESSFVESVRLARDAMAAQVELGEALNNLSIVYFALSKFADAQSVLKEALALACQDSKELTILRACCLNNRARLSAEFEQYAESEADLFEAIALAEPYHPVHAAEMSGNLSRLYAGLPEWRHKSKSASEEFERLHAQNEQLEIYFDDIAEWRRPGNNWDRAGCASSESINARIISSRASYLYDSKHDAIPEFEAILQLDEQTKAVPPHMVIHACMSIADAFFHSGDHLAAARYCENALRAINSSYLRSHPAKYHTLLEIATYSILGNSQEKSRELFAAATEFVCNQLGEHNPHFARCLAAKALLAQVLGVRGGDPLTDQKIALRKSIDIHHEFYADNHSKVIVLNVALSDNYIRANQLEDAQNILVQTLKSARNSFHANEMECRCLHAFTELRLKQRRIGAAQEYLQKIEALLDQQLYNNNEKKLPSWFEIAKQYVDAGLNDEAERVYRKAVDLVPPLRTDLIQSANLQLALCLMKTGKASEAAEILNQGGDKADTESHQPSKRDQLVKYSRQAWALHNDKRFDEAKTLATKVVQEAHALMPDAEESLLIALSILVDQAKSENKAEEIQRLTGVLTSYKGSIRVQCILPTFHLEAAQIFAKQGSIKAEPLFEQALQSAEEVQALSPQTLDACCFSYVNHCLVKRNFEKGLQMCQRLLTLRAASAGITSQAYASALASKAVLLLESDASGAEASSMQALQLMDALPDRDDLQLFLVLATRVEILKKLLRFDESKAVQERMDKLRVKIQSQVAPTR